MADVDPRLMQLQLERSRLVDGDSFPEAVKLLEKEIGRIEAGFDVDKFIEIHQNPAKVEFRVRLPVKEYPQANFVGRIVGPQGATIKELQQQSNCKISVFGRGSIKDKAKEEELRKQGGKYAHLNHDLHVHLSCNGSAVSCYKRIVTAMELLEPLLAPDYHEDGQPFRGPGDAFGMPPRGRGMPMRGMRGGPAGWPAGNRNAGPPGVHRGGRGQGVRGAPGARGGHRGRGGAPSGGGGGHRGAPRGGTGGGRGQGRGGAPRVPPTSQVAPSADYSAGDAYEYESAPAYMDPNAYGSAEAGDAYYDYTQNEGQAYDAYGGAWGEEAAEDGGYGKVASGRTASNYRAHPY